MKQFYLFLYIVFSFFGTSLFSSDLEVGEAVILSTDGTNEEIGVFYIIESPSGIEILGNVTGLNPGKHGIHIHQYGNIGNKGKNAGTHYNPADVPHGYSPLGDLEHAHPGDLGNIEVDEDGVGRLSVFVPGVFLTNGRYTIAGRSFIIHSDEDQFTQPTGDAGGRIAGGVITIIPLSSAKQLKEKPVYKKKEKENKPINKKKSLPSNPKQSDDDLNSPSPKTYSFTS